MPPALGRFLRISGISAAIAFVYGLVRSTRRPAPVPPAGVASWPSLVPEPAVEARTGPVQFAETAPPSSTVAWIEPVDGQCPDSHPIKGNADSMIFHVPDGTSYERTRAERCYCTADDAEADGFRQAKR